MWLGLGFVWVRVKVRVRVGVRVRSVRCRVNRVRVRRVRVRVSRVRVRVWLTNPPFFLSITSPPPPSLQGCQSLHPGFVLKDHLWGRERVLGQGPNSARTQRKGRKRKVGG